MSSCAASVSTGKQPFGQGLKYFSCEAAVSPVEEDYQKLQDSYEYFTPPIPMHAHLRKLLKQLVHCSLDYCNLNIAKLYLLLHIYDNENNYADISMICLPDNYILQLQLSRQLSCSTTIQSANIYTLNNINKQFQHVIHRTYVLTGVCLQLNQSKGKNHIMI